MLGGVKVKDSITADQIVAGAKGAKHKLPFFRVKLVKERSRSYPVSSITQQADLVKVARMELADIPHEELIAIGLSGQNVPIGIVRVSQGGLNSTAVVANDIIRPLIAMGASAFVVAHNHPSGDPTPSREDYVMTDRIKKAAECVGLQILDHIVIGGVRGGGHRAILERYATGTFD